MGLVRDVNQIGSLSYPFATYSVHLGVVGVSHFLFGCLGHSSGKSHMYVLACAVVAGFVDFEDACFVDSADVVDGYVVDSVSVVVDFVDVVAVDFVS